MWRTANLIRYFVRTRPVDVKHQRVHFDRDGRKRGKGRFDSEGGGWITDASKKRETGAALATKSNLAKYTVYPTDDFSGS